MPHRSEPRVGLVADLAESGGRIGGDFAEPVLPGYRIAINAQVIERRREFAREREGDCAHALIELLHGNWRIRCGLTRVSPDEARLIHFEIGVVDCADTPPRRPEGERRLTVISLNLQVVWRVLASANSLFSDQQAPRLPVCPVTANGVLIVHFQPVRRFGCELIPINGSVR